MQKSPVKEMIFFCVITCVVAHNLLFDDDRFEMHIHLEPLNIRFENPKIRKPIDDVFDDIGLKGI